MPENPISKAGHYLLTLYVVRFNLLGCYKTTKSNKINKITKSQNQQNQQNQKKKFFLISQNRKRFQQNQQNKQNQKKIPKFFFFFLISQNR